MVQSSSKIQAVPTHIITGFLGAGKTSAIKHLLSSKPQDESWAVLVNEFGELGVDASLIEGPESNQQLFVKEVPGGCMCCASGLSMKVALNQLLKLSNPDRLLIEPSGLGHTKEVLQALSSDHFKEVLSLQKNITLVDARNLSDSRYTEHETFNQQIEIADMIVGNKVDLYGLEDKQKLRDYIVGISAKPLEVVFTSHGRISLKDLLGSSACFDVKQDACHVHDHQHHLEQMPELAGDMVIPEIGYIKVMTEGEGFYSQGYRFVNDKVFDEQKVQLLFKSLGVERLKAVLITETGSFAYNMATDCLDVSSIKELHESRIEVISCKPLDLEDDLLKCCL